MAIAMADEEDRSGKAAADRKLTEDPNRAGKKDKGQILRLQDLPPEFR